MKIVKPQWVTHGGLSIYSIDIHPDGTRLATGGGDAKIKIWSMAPITLSEVELDADTPKLLCSIENAHFQTVNCVKWSKDGKYLASSSDDKLIMIWGLSSSNYLIKGSVENWVCVATLRGHTSDISEVSWSPDNKYLATCSFDKSVLIWDTNKFNLVRRLEEHQGFVKGLTWDPLGRYLASQSEDKSLIIWRTIDWVVETTITKPFQHSGASFFLRPSWTPDGQFIVATHGINNQKHTGVLISRKEWEIGLDLVGHRKAVVVSRCSSKIYKDLKNKESKFCLILLGDQDSTISLWSSLSPRSIMVTTRLFEQTIQDMSWCSDGFSFVACSTDGTIGYVSFEPEEVGGTPITVDEKKAFFKNYYGDAVTVDKDGNLINTGGGSGGGGNIQSSAASNGSHALLPENPDQLAMEESNTIGGAGASSEIGENGSGQNVNGVEPTNQVTLQPTQMALQNQKQTIMPSGKRRITPIFIGSSSQNITKPQPINIPLHLQSQSSSLQLSDQQPTSPSDEQQPMDSSAIGGDTNNTTTTTTTTTSTVPFGLNKLTPNGRSEDSERLSHPRINKDRDHHDRHKSSGHSDRERDKSDRDEPPQIPSRFSSRSSGHGGGSSSKRRSIEPEPQHVSKKKKSINKSSSHPQQHHYPQQPQNIIVSTAGIATFSIPLPTLTNKLSKKLVDQPTSQINSLNNRLLSTTNTANTSISNNIIATSIIIDINITEQELLDNTIEYFSTIRYLTHDQQIWENKIPGRISLVTGNKQWCASVTSNSILYIFNSHGTIVMSNIVLRNQVSFLECNKSNHLLAITCDGFVSVWNVARKRVELSNRELPFLENRNNLTIVHAFVTEATGKPVITFSNGDSFVFSADIGEWIKITDRLGALSEFNSNDTNSTGILSTLQNNVRLNSILNSGGTSGNNNNNNTNSGGGGGGGVTSVSNLLLMTNNGDPQQQQLSSSLFLEKQLWLSQVLESPLEYRHWLLIYAKYLTSAGIMVKLVDMCTDLLGPSLILDNNNVVDVGVVNNNLSPWESNILGLSKRTLLKEILPIMASNRNLQRLVGQFKESLNAFTKNNTCLTDPFDNLLK